MMNYSDKKESLKAFVGLIKALLKLKERTVNIDDIICNVDTEKLETRMSDIMMESGATTDSIGEMWESGEFFPNHPIKKVAPLVNISDKETSCTKNYKGKGTLAPGVIFFHCLQHSKCVGFVVLQEPESLTQISQVIIRRFSESELICYDNGCNLSEFFLNR